MAWATRVHDRVPARLAGTLHDWLPCSEFAVSLQPTAARCVELVGTNGRAAAIAVVAEDRPTLSGAPVLVACAAPADVTGATDVAPAGVAAIVAALVAGTSPDGDIEVVGPATLARPVAETLASHLGGTVSIVLGERLMVATEVVQPDVPGAPRRATPADRDLLASWLHAFAVEALGVDEEWGETWAEAVDNDDWDLWVWEVHGEAVSFANHRRTTAVSSRIGPVYTPPEHRGHGYAAGVTAAVTAALLATGDPHVALFTDETNATSNALYARIGFRDAGAQGGWHVARS